MNLLRSSALVTFPNLVSRNTARRTSKAALAAALLACAALSLSGCKKKEPPPEEPAPVEAPPPPAPTVVSFDSISQELQVHPAVQFASGLAVTDESLVRATVKLADALARGDAAKMRPLISKPAERAIRNMETNQIWQPGMADIEAVRLVYAGPVDPNAGKITLETAAQLLKARNENDLPPGITPEIAYQIGAVIGRAMALSMFNTNDAASATPENIDKMLKAFNALNINDTITKFLNDSQFENARKEVEGIISTLQADSPLPSGEYLLLFAVQHKDGAELSGWGAEKAFGKWQFNNGTTVADIKPRASEFDTIGMAGFSAQLAQAPAAADDANKPKDAKPDEKPPEGGQTKKPEDEPNGPIKKRTPAGPIGIPGGG